MPVGMCLYYEVQAAKLTLTLGQIGSEGSGCSRVALALAHCCDSVERERLARCSEKIKRPTQDLPSLSKDSPNTGPSTFFLSQELKSAQPCIIIMTRFLATLLKMESSRTFNAAKRLWYCCTVPAGRLSAGERCNGKIERHGWIARYCKLDHSDLTSCPKLVKHVTIPSSAMAAMTCRGSKYNIDQDS